jgi:hypothetical protein
MVRFWTRSKVSETVKVGPFRLRISRPLGRGRLWGSAGTRVGRRTRLSFSTPLGRYRRNGYRRNGRKRR